MTDLLAVRDLVKSYGPTPALRGLSLGVAEGEIVAITGPSGCGKSTLLHCAAGILRPDSGEVIYAGARLDTRSEAERSRLRRTDFGVLFQFGHLVAELTAADNVALPLLLAGASRRGARTTALSWLDQLGVAGVAGALPGQMAGGQRQRVAVARALAGGPKVVFADEPTGALDTLAGEQVLGHLVRLARSHGVTVLLATHDATVAAYADREVVLRDGALDPGGLGLDRGFAALAEAGRAEAGRAEAGRAEAGRADR